MHAQNHFNFHFCSLHFGKLRVHIEVARLDRYVGALWKKKLHFMTPCKLQRDKEEYSLIMLSNPIEDALLDKSRCYFKRVWFQNYQHIKTEKTTQHELTDRVT